MARRWWVLVALVPLLRGALESFTGAVSSAAPRRRGVAARRALDAEGLAAFGSFSVLAGAAWWRLLEAEGIDILRQDKIG